jgi:signal transduction histidine kinase
MDLISILLATVSLIMIGLSILVISGEKKLSNRIFSLFILCISLWSLGILGFRLTSSEYLGLIFSDFNYVIALLIATLFSHFSLIFPSERKVWFPYLLALYSPAILILIGFIIDPNIILMNVYTTNEGLKLVMINIINYTIYALYFITFLTIAYVNLFNSYLTNLNKIVKSQIKMLIIGTLLPYLIAMYFDLILAASDYEYVWAGPLMAFVVVYVILYAAYKHHLLNIEAITAEILAGSLWIFIVLRTLLSIKSQGVFADIGLLILSSIIGLFLIRSIKREVSARKKSSSLARDLEKANDLLTSLNSTLSEKVAEQTAEVRKAFELEKHARRELEKLNETKDQFIMITQHHLRTPVTSIRWELEAMLGGTYGAFSPEQRAALQDTNTAVHRLTRIVDDFLNITALKVGSQILNIETGNLKPLVEDVLSELKIDIEKMHLKVVYPHDTASWPDLQIDAGKMREVLLIILENAVKYNVDGGSIDVMTDSKDGYLEIIVKNTGFVLTSEDKERLFSRLFYRGVKAQKANPIGMGIGLSVARAIVRAHKGMLEICSRDDGKGVVVKLRILISKIATM